LEETLAETDRGETRWRTDRNAGKEPVDVVCMGDEGASSTLRWALRHTPRHHALLVLNGIPTSKPNPKGRASIEDEDDKHAARENKLRKMCKEEDTDCRFLHFTYNNPTEFGEKVCRYANKNDAKSIIMRRQSDTDGLSRILADCSVPIIMVNKDERTARRGRKEY